MANEKHKKVLEIADELDALGSKFHDDSLKDIAAKLRSSVTSKKTSNESTESGESEGGEGDGEDGGNGGNNPPKKPPFTPEP